MAHFADRLLASVAQKGTPLCVGIDPRLDRLPAEIRETEMKGGGDPLRLAAKATERYCRELIDVVAGIVPAVKFQMAFFEMFGAHGMRALEDLSWHAMESGLVVIGDGKRNDIGSTASAYAQAYLGGFEINDIPVSAFAFDALTVNGYLGTDGIAPFLEACDASGKGVFVLVKTSNPSAGELQDLKTGDENVFERMAGLVDGWGRERKGESGMSSVGAVVAATYPELGASLRQRLPATPFLIPGYGAQGGTADALTPLFAEGGKGAVVNSSRGVIFAWEKEPYASKFGERRWTQAVEAAARDAAAELASAAGQA